jgi:magnesium-transporting ATPase (P-type)
MDFHALQIDSVLNAFGSNAKNGLSAKKRDENARKYGRNILTKKKKQSFLSKLFDCLKEPMIII